MTPAATPDDTRSAPGLRRKTAAILASSAAVAVAAALLTARGAPAPRGPACAMPGQDIGGLGFAVRAQSCHIVRGVTETHIAVEVTAPSRDGAQREDVAMALVIDRSGSMVGQPLADAKLAAARAVDALSPDDFVAVVAYSTDAQTITELGRATPEHKARAKAAIEAIRADGGTNISAGVTLGATQLAGRDRDDLGRVVLISDGQANEGIYDRGGLAALAGRTASGGVSLTAVGVGLDFDEVTMTEMAVAGRGNYYFVERAADLVGMFDRELGSLGETVVVDARLDVTPAAGVEILEAYGYRLDRSGEGVVVPVADLRAGERRKVVLRVRVRADQAGPRQLATTKLTWRAVGEHQARVADGAVGVTVTDDARLAAASRVVEAEAQVQEAQMSRALDDATSAYEQGDYARARQILDSQAAAVEASAAATGDKDLERRVKAVKQRAETNFAAEPSGRGAGGSRAKKANRADAYELAR